MIESQFRNMKDSNFVDISPVRHWTDGSIRCHVFHCVTGLMLLTVLKKKLYKAGIDLSLNKMVKLLRGIKQIEFEVPKKKGAIRKTVTLNKTQKQMFEILNLSKYER